METWCTLRTGEGSRTRITSTRFGAGQRVANFMASDDVAEFVCRIVTDSGVINERIRVGGPSTLS